jgi:site-specific recombinase XerD
LLASPDRTSAAGRRDTALLWFLYNTGARAQEVVQVRVADVRFGPPQQVRLLGKGRKERICPLWPQTVSFLRDMLRDRDIPDDAKDLLFLNYAARPLTRFGLVHIVRRYVARTSSSRPSLTSKRVSPHTFRHTTALHLLQSGVEINVVRSWLGHASVQTTHEYVEIDLETKRAALESTGPRPRPPRRPRWQKPDILEWLESL